MDQESWILRGSQKGAESRGHLSQSFVLHVDVSVLGEGLVVVALEVQGKVQVDNVSRKVARYTAVIDDGCR